MVGAVGGRSTFSAVFQRLKRCRLQPGCSGTGTEQNNQFLLHHSAFYFFYGHNSGEMKYVMLKRIVFGKPDSYLCRATQKTSVLKHGSS